MTSPDLISWRDSMDLFEVHDIMGTFRCSVFGGHDSGDLLDEAMKSSATASPTPSSNLTSPTPSPTLSSPTPSSDAHHMSTLSSGSEDDAGDGGHVATCCHMCQETFTLPKVLACFHTFCLPCLERTLTCPDKIACPECDQVTHLPPQGVYGLLTDYAVSNTLSAADLETTSPSCTGCKSAESDAVGRCSDCAHFLCANCFLAHQTMHCFQGHRILTLTEVKKMALDPDWISGYRPVSCPRHHSDILEYFCKTCVTPICEKCSYTEHCSGHIYESLDESARHQAGVLEEMVIAGKTRAEHMKGAIKGLNHVANRLQVQFHKAQNDVNDTVNFCRKILDECKRDALNELDESYGNKASNLGRIVIKLQENVGKIYEGCDFINRLVKHSSNTEILCSKKFVDSSFVEMIHNSVPNLNDHLKRDALNIEFSSNFQAIQAGIRSTFGYVRRKMNDEGESPFTHISPPQSIPQNQYMTPNTLQTSPFLQNLSHLVNSRMSMAPPLIAYDKWCVSSIPDVLPPVGITIPQMSPNDPILDLTSKLSSPSALTPRTHIRRQKMIYHCKFGEYGSNEAQFLEPSGVAVTAHNDIVVADTNNHRIQIFSRDGAFLFQFGQYGRHDGHMMYPNRVAVDRMTGDIVLTERSPTHQLQVYTQYGQFLRKFGANILQHPRGITVDNKGRIVVIECKVMRILIFERYGTLLNKFSCSRHLEFPNGVVVNDSDEVFISDNRAHSVKVFSYTGTFLREIGGQGLTNYPIGVGLSAEGHIVVADNHNNFNLTVFSQDGQLVTALESKVKHAQCFDIALLDDGSVALASKDLRVYVYRCPSLGGTVY